MDQLTEGFCPMDGDSGFILNTMIRTILQLYCKLSDQKQWPSNIQPHLLKDMPDYDFIIIGSGSAGSTVASRLSENKNWKILLIEAGDTPSPESEIPSLLLSMQRTKEDWNYTSEPDPKYCQSMVDKQCKLPRGKLLGGSSAMNDFLYIRGNKEDYNLWEKFGNTGWDYKSVLQFFKKSEKLYDNVNDDQKKYHGFEGKFKISSFKPNELKSVLMSVWKELGYEEKDLNGKSQIGFMNAFGNVYQGRRYSSAKSYLSDIKPNQNLHVLYNAYVTKIIIDETTKQATGVEVKLNSGDTLKIKSTKEVIISTGTINTPQLLMLSGIGPSEHLKKIGIKVIQNLAVGKNLQDHVFLPVFFSLNKGNGEETSIEEIYLYMIEYLFRKEGPLASVTVSDFTGFTDTKNNASKIPDIQIMNAFAPINDTIFLPNFYRNLNYDKETVNRLVNLNKDSFLLATYIIMLNPKSAGRIELKSKNPDDKPLIYPNYFHEEEDMLTMIRGAKFIEKFENTTQMQELNIVLEDWRPPSCDSHDFKSDDYWRCLIHNIASTSHNLVGTAKMGPKSDNMAVVDSRLRVHGIKGLRVIDGSIMPTIIKGNINAPIIMIGEKGADMIKEDWSAKSEQKEEL